VLRMPYCGCGFQRISRRPDVRCTLACETYMYDTLSLCRLRCARWCSVLVSCCWGRTGELGSLHFISFVVSAGRAINVENELQFEMQHQMPPRRRDKSRTVPTDKNIVSNPEFPHVSPLAPHPPRGYGYWSNPGYSAQMQHPLRLSIKTPSTILPECTINNKAIL